jgi:hypothetical protein
MNATRSRRSMLRMIAVGTLGGAVAACSQPAAIPTSQPVVPSAVPLTALPAPTLAAPTAVPVPTNAPASEATVPAPVAVPTAEAPTAAPLADPQGSLIATSAAQFLATLDDSQRTRATYQFDDAERVRWHWTTPQGFPRNGVPLMDLQPTQRTAALALLEASVTAGGYQKALAIMDLQRYLGNNPEAYYVTVFGSPAADSIWGWRWEGHHLSHHFTLKSDQIAATPFFLGAWPETTDAGLRAMAREEDAARELMLGLPENLRAQVIFQQNTLTRHVTQNEPQVNPLEPIGLSYAELPAPQQQLIREIVETYLAVMPPATAQRSRSQIEAAGWETLRFGWAGMLEPRKPHYYRLQGSSFLLEYDNSRNGGTHIHSVWREYAADFGRDL